VAALTQALHWRGDWHNRLLLLLLLHLNGELPDAQQPQLSSCLLGVTSTALENVTQQAPVHIIAKHPGQHDCHARSLMNRCV
jgi:hypothetical protein